MDGSSRLNPDEWCQLCNRISENGNALGVKLLNVALGIKRIPEEEGRTADSGQSTILFGAPGEVESEDGANASANGRADERNDRAKNGARCHWCESDW